MLQGETNKTILLTLMCADGAVMFGITTRFLCGLIKKYPTILFFSFKQEGAWGREWGACDLGPPCTCVNYCLLLGLLHCWQLAKTSHCVCWVCHIDNDQEIGAVHLHQVLP
jgi:hypothetical protein